MKIYGFTTFNLTKVLLTAEELNLDYQYITIDIKSSEQKSPAHLARHPLGKVPVVEIDGSCYIESNSICRLLAESNGNALYSDDLTERTKINQWIDLMSFHMGRWMGALYFQEVIKPKLMEKEADQAQIDEANGFLEQQLPAFNYALEQSSFLIGESLTIADIIAFSYTQTHEYTSLNLDDYPQIALWYQNIKARPSFEPAMKNFPSGSILPG